MDVGSVSVTEVLTLLYISGVRVGQEVYHVFSLALGTITC
jgi:hypothetical protein